MRVRWWSILVLAMAFIFGIANLAVHLHGVQVENTAEFKKNLSRQATRRMRKPAVRGRILDSAGGVLAMSRARRDIVCDLSAFLKSGGFSNTVEAVNEGIVRLAGALGIDRPASLDAKHIARHIRTQSAVPMCVWRDADETVLAKLEERASEFPGFSVEAYGERVYPQGTFAAHLVGYTGRDRDPGDPDSARMLAYELDMKGRSGLEAYYDEYLSGVPGAIRIPVDARGFKPRGAARDNIALEEQKEREAQDGLDLVLTIDPILQAAAERELKGQRGACVALDPRNGAVLALVSSPAFDPNEFVPYISRKRYRELTENPDKPLLNRATAGLYAPGSTFKPVTAIAALGSGINPKQDYDCTGVYKLGSMRLRCWNRWGQGALNMRGAIEQSCNPYFARIGYMIGSNALFRTAREFGFESKTGIDYAPDCAGSLTAPPFYPGLISQTAIGQGRLLVTPLQMAVECAALANGGKIFQPYLKQRPAGMSEPEPIRRIKCRTEDLELVRLGMRDVVSGAKGTGKALADLPVTCAGKTGTAQIGNDLKNTWVLAFAPYENPTVALALLIEHGESGGKTAAPRARNILAARFGERN